MLHSLVAFALHADLAPVRRLAIVTEASKGNKVRYCRKLFPLLFVTRLLTFVV
jgi:hypothetical protein